MHPATPRLAAVLRRRSGLADRLDVLHDAYAGDRCVIVTCGPSLGELDPTALRAALEGTLCLVVKQGIDVVGEEADVLCFNDFNVTRYRTPSKHTIRCAVGASTARVPQLNRADLRFPQERADGDLGRSLAVTRDFDRYLLGSSDERPWGPGIMYELVLHLAVHLGVGEIVTIGWDIANAAGRNTHYYDQQVVGAGDGFDRERGEAFSTSSARRRLPSSIKIAGRWGRAAWAHGRGALYNKAVPVPGESNEVAASTADAARWLGSHGIALRVVTTSTYLDASIERLSRDALFDHLRTR